MSGRDVALAIWVRDADLPKTGHALDALQAAMAWDETVYGREYDLGMFNIVTVDDFNFGAMENKGHNIFNSRYIIVDTDTAPEQEYETIEGGVWTDNITHSREVEEPVGKKGGVKGSKRGAEEITKK